MGLVIGTCRGPACLEVFFPIRMAGAIRDRRGRSGTVRPAQLALNCLPHVDALVCRRETFNFADRLFGAKSGLSDDTSGLTDLSANLLRPRPTAVRRRWRVRWHPVHFGDGLCGIAHRRRIAGDCAHHISDRAPERFHGTFNLLGPLLAGSGVQQNLRVEATVARHRPLEDADRSRQARHAVAPIRSGASCVAAAWRGCHNVEEFMAQRRAACLTWILPDAAEETR